MVTISKKARSFMRNVEGSLRKGAQRPYRTPVTSRMNRIAASTTSKLDYLQKKVDKLTKVAVNRIQYGNYITHQCYTAGGSDSYQATPLLKFNDWTRIFGTDADDEVNKQCVIKSMKCNYYMSTNEPTSRAYQVFVVSLKDNASELLNNDGTLAALTASTHYYSSQVMTLLNLNFFNIHYHRKFITGTPDSSKAAIGAAPAVQTIGTTPDAQQRFGTFALNFGKNGMQVKNPSGDWKAGVYPKDPSKNYFLLTFWSGDSLTDGEYATFAYSALTQVDVSG